MFHVPERARVTNGPMSSPPGAGNYGAFIVPSCEPGWNLALICDDGESTGWEHVSVRAFRYNKSRIPNWREMCYTKEIFWGPEDVVIQLHPAESQYVNQHPDVLHLWRSLREPIPLPPLGLV